MRLLGPTLAVTALGVLLATCDTAKNQSSRFDGELDTEKEQFSYAIGVEVGVSVKGIGTEIDFGAFTRGVEDVLGEREQILSAQEASDVKRKVFSQVQQEKAQARAGASVKNQQDGAAFLEKNKGQEGVTVTNSGLQYKVLRAGNGPTPKATDKVRVHYTGTLLDGTEFDNSLTRGEPAVFAVNQVIRGWSEGLQLMQVGGKYRLWIPSSLAYGERGAGDKIGPNAVLAFDVELLGIVE